jgi:hypothetical protein
MQIENTGSKWEIPLHFVSGNFQALSRLPECFEETQNDLFLWLMGAGVNAHTHSGWLFDPTASFFPAPLTV